MAFIPVPKTIQICLRGIWTGQAVEICLGLLKPTAIVAGDLATATSAMDSWRIAELVPLTSSDVTFTDWYAVDLTTSTSPTLTTPISVSPQGTVGGGSVYNNVSLTTTFYTDKRGRSYRGRSYFYGLPITSTASPTEADPPSAALIGGAFAALNSYLSPTFVHAVISRYNANVARTTGVATPVTLYANEIRLDSQRRRLEGRGA